MKNIFIVSLILVMSIGIKAQTTDTQTSGNGSFIGLIGGYSTPLGNWKKVAYNTNDVGGWLPNNSDNNNAGFAGNGSTIGFEGVYYFSKYVGFGGVLSHSAFNVSTKGLDTLSAGYRASFDVDQVTTTISGNYSIWAFMPGIYFKYPLSEKFSLIGKLLAGFTIASTPNIAVDVEDGGVEDGSFYQLSAIATSIGINGGIGFSYKVGNHFSVYLQGNYFYSKPDFFFANLNRVANVGRLVNEYNQPLSYLNTSLGLSYIIGKK